MTEDNMLSIKVYMAWFCSVMFPTYASLRMIHALRMTPAPYFVSLSFYAVIWLLFCLLLTILMVIFTYLGH